MSDEIDLTNILLKEDIIKVMTKYYLSGKCKSMSKYGFFPKVVDMEIANGWIETSFPEFVDAKWNSMIKIDSISFLHKQLNGFGDWPDIARIIISIIRNYNIQAIISE
jgi:hypothetical protein